MSHDGEAFVLTEAPTEPWAPVRAVRPRQATQAEVDALLASLPQPKRFAATLRGDRFDVRFVAEPTARNSQRDALAEVRRAALSLGWDVIALGARGVAEVYPWGQAGCSLGCACDHCEGERLAAEAGDEGELFAGQSDRRAA